MAGGRGVGAASVPGTGEKSDVAVWAEVVFLTKISGCRAL